MDLIEQNVLQPCNKWKPDKWAVVQKGNDNNIEATCSLSTKQSLQRASQTSSVLTFTGVWPVAILYTSVVLMAIVYEYIRQFSILTVLHRPKLTYHTMHSNTCICRGRGDQHNWGELTDAPKTSSMDFTEWILSTLPEAGLDATPSKQRLDTTPEIPLPAQHASQPPNLSVFDTAVTQYAMKN